MNETERWPNGTLPPGMDDMLREARAEQPGDHLLDGTLMSLSAAGLLGAAGLTASAKAATPLLTKVGTTLVAMITWKGAGWTVGALVLGASVASHYGLFTGSPSEPPQPASDQQVAAGPALGVMGKVGAAKAREARSADDRSDGAAAASASAVLGVEGLPEDADTDHAPASADERSGAPTANAGKYAPTADRLQNPRFRRELALVDRARAAVTQGDAATALRLLGQYEREFGDRGSFVPEVRYLKMEAHSTLGHREKARRAARDNLESDSDGAHSDRARSGLERKAP